MAISKEQIIEAAEHLVSEGVNPSMQAVREHLGSGSFATISPVLREWKEKREATTLAVLEMPSDVKGALDRFGAELWKAASALATAQFEKLKDECRNSIEAANRERDEALEEIERLESQNLQHNNKLSSINAEVESLKNQVDDERMINAALQQRNDDLQEFVAGLKTDLKESREDCKKALEKLDTLRQAQMELSRTNGQLTAKVEALDKELVAMTEARNEIKDEYARVSVSLAALYKKEDQDEELSEDTIKKREQNRARKAKQKAKKNIANDSPEENDQAEKPVVSQAKPKSKKTQPKPE
jgi:chromosome segregation ATPase